MPYCGRPPAAPIAVGCGPQRRACPRFRTLGEGEAGGKRVKRMLGGDAFRSIRRRDLTDLVSEVSGLTTTRLKAEMAARLTDQLQRQGVRVFPPLTETATSDAK